MPVLVPISDADRWLNPFVLDSWGYDSSMHTLQDRKSLLAALQETEYTGASYVAEVEYCRDCSLWR